MKNNTSLHFIKETTIIAIIAALCYLMIAPIVRFISWHYLLFLILGAFVIGQYARVILFERLIVWMRPFSMKFFLFLLNIPLFFLVLTWMMNFNGQMEDYGFDILSVHTKDLSAGMLLEQYAYLKSITYFIGIASMIIIVMFQFRVLYSIFKYRELPSYLKR
ncbi:MAG: hypothetical protein R2730_02530 [Chitinophagales bacterium]